jgi:hypothetical protein
LAALRGTFVLRGREEQRLITREIAAGAAPDLSPCDVTKDVVLGAVGMQRNFGAVDHLEQFRLVGMKSCEQAVEGARLASPEIYQYPGPLV